MASKEQDGKDGKPLGCCKGKSRKGIHLVSHLLISMDDSRIIFYFTETVFCQDHTYIYSEHFQKLHVKKISVFYIIREAI